MTTQFDRKVEVIVEDVKITDLDVEFRVIKTLKKEPNTIDLTIFNLNPDNRDQLAQVKDVTVQLSAGYKGRPAPGALGAVDAALGALGSPPPSESGFGLIFEGDVRDVASNFEPPNWLTKLESGDGEKGVRKARVNKSMPPGTLLPIAIQELANELGVGLGNTALAAVQGTLVEAGKEFLQGVTFSGQASKEFDRLMKSSGLEWSIQDGALQILPVGTPLLDLPVILSGETGLVGSPTIGNDGIVKASALLNSDIVPARLVVLNSDVIKGRFRAERCEYTGATLGNDWFVDMEMKEL